LNATRRNAVPHLIKLLAPTPLKTAIEGVIRNSTIAEHHGINIGNPPLGSSQNIVYDHCVSLDSP
jgi:hypothetical protein